ncbi:nucleoside deaminase [Vagococcus fluvialis]|uniref:Nucleoside deaminase n=1 Tax=Vagococcus fluvialis TaxID=2738 RepID=A0A7X6DA06_9ENTE|nr:nucleoside deaminase [Vagococcus fluvialis]NKC68525.1 nucleoside deaminase [Vagococcus fluvialis]
MVNENIFMKRALELAENSKQKGNEPFGAILVKNGKIIKEGTNQIHSNSDPTNHAELGLIRDFCQETGITNLSEYTLYTSCEPCCMCSGAMVWSNLGKMRYSVKHDELARIAGANIMIGSEEVFKRSPNKPDVISGLLNAEGLEIIKNYKW